jgi:hypothetical protein
MEPQAERRAVSAEPLGFLGPFSRSDFGVSELVRSHPIPCPPGKFCGREVVESLVRSTHVVLNAPSFDLRLRSSIVSNQ